MSSDVQGEGTRQEPSRGLEDLKEATDETEADVSPDARLVALDAGDPDVLFLPLNLTVGINPRHSYPPTKELLPYQHVMRSFSDSHLCLKLTTTANFTPYKLPSPMGSSSLLLVEEEGWDAEYVQQWLRFVAPPPPPSSLSHPPPVSLDVRVLSQDEHACNRVGLRSFDLGKRERARRDRTCVTVRHPVVFCASQCRVESPAQGEILPKNLANHRRYFFTQR